MVFPPFALLWYEKKNHTLCTKFHIPNRMPDKETVRYFEQCKNRKYGKTSKN